jgi:hypothetical protein
MCPHKILREAVGRMFLRSEFPDYDILRNLKLVKIAHDRFREVCKRTQGVLGGGGRGIPGRRNVSKSEQN